jgi:hypothetical protein
MERVEELKRFENVMRKNMPAHAAISDNTIGNSSHNIYQSVLHLASAQNGSSNATTTITAIQFSGKKIRHSLNLLLKMLSVSCCHY